MARSQHVDGHEVLRALLAPIDGTYMFQELYGRLSTDEMDTVGAFAQLVEERINRDPKSFVDAIRVFNNSYQWTGGVPNIRSGEGKIEIHRHSEWSEFFTDPQSKNIPIIDRVHMARVYLREVVVCNYDNPEMWRALGTAFPGHKALWKLMEKGAQRRSAAP